MKKVVRQIVFNFFTHIAQLLPSWDEAQYVQVFLPRLSLPVTLPVNYKMLPDSFAKKFVSIKSIRNRRIFLLSNVCVNGDAVVFKNLRIFNPSLTWLLDSYKYKKGKLLLKQWKSNSKTVQKTQIVALAYDAWSAENYYHWMIESLPRLLIVKTQFPDCLLLVPKPAPEFITTTIKLLGFLNIYELSRKELEILKVANLVLPELVYYEEEEKIVEGLYKQQISGRLQVKQSLSEMTFDFGQEELIVSVKKMLLESITNKLVLPSKKIFISRSRQKIRRLLNENDVEAILDKHQFETVFFEGLPFLKQVDLMLNTSIFISIHGSNMVNILFLQAGSKVIELMNKDYLNDAYYLLASSIGVPYYSIPCTMADKTIKPNDDTVKINDADLLVDLQELEQVLNLALA